MIETAEKSKKEKVKAETKMFRELIKDQLKEQGHFISDIVFMDLELPEPKDLTSGVVMMMFNKYKEMYYNNEFKKLVTSMKQEKDRLSYTTFKAQYNNFIATPNAEWSNKLFNRKQTISAYKQALNI